MKKVLTYRHIGALVIGFTLAIYASTATAQSAYKGSYLSFDLSRWSIGGGGGLLLFKGDAHGLLEAKSQNDFLNFHATGFLQYRLTNHISFRGQSSYYRIFSKPSLKEEYSQYANRPAIRSANAEAFVGVKYDLVSKEWIEKGNARWNLYGLIGAGITYFNPQNALTGESLRAGNPAEHGKNGKFYYQNIMPIMPWGLGVSYYFFDNQAITFEVVARTTWTDWLDHIYRKEGRDFSNDKYLFIGFQYEFAFLAKKRNKFKYHRRRR